MAAPKGHPRYGGRQKGTPNKATASLEAICQEEGVDPFRGLCRLAKSGDTALELAAYKELCQYLYPKRKALEVTAEVSEEMLEAAKAIQEMSKEDLLRVIAAEMGKLKK